MSEFSKTDRWRGRQVTLGVLREFLGRNSTGPDDQAVTVEVDLNSQRPGEPGGITLSTTEVDRD